MKRKFQVLILILLALICILMAVACNNPASSGKDPVDPDDPSTPDPPGPSYTTMEEYAEQLANDPFLTGIPGTTAEIPRELLDENWDKLLLKKQPIAMNETITETFDKDYFSSSLSPANGTYQGGTYYITDGEDAVTPGNHSLVFVGDGPANGGNFDRITLKGRKLVAGAYYKLKVTAKVLTTGRSFWFYQTTDGVSGTALFNLSSDTENQIIEKEISFLATSGDSHLMILVEQGAAGDKMAFDDISLTRVDTPPLIENLSIARSGNTFKAEYSYHDEEGDSLTGEEVRWFAALDKSGTRKTVLASSGKEFTLTSQLLTQLKGQYIGFEVRPRNDGENGDKAVFATAYATAAIAGTADYGVSDISSGVQFIDDFEVLRETGSLLTSPSVGAAYLASYITAEDSIDGNYSLFLSTDPSINSGCDFGGLAFANGGYKVKVDFDFKVLKKTGGTRDFNFYVQFRAKDNGYGYDVHNNGSVGVSDPEIGKTYHYSGIFDLKDIGGYYMAFFTSFSGVEIMLDNITVQRYEAVPVDLTEANASYTENFEDLLLEIGGNVNASEFLMWPDSGTLHLNFKTPKTDQMTGFTFKNFDLGTNQYLNVKLVFDITAEPAYMQDVFLLINGSGPQFSLSSLIRSDGKYEIDYVFKDVLSGTQNEVALVTHYVDSADREFDIVLYELKLSAMNPVEEDFDETGSVTNLVNVGDKFIENFESIPSGIAFDQEYGSTTVIKGYKYNDTSILGTSLYMYAADRSLQPWLILNGLNLGTDLKYRVSCDVRFVGELPEYVKMTLQKIGSNDINVQQSLAEFERDGDVYHVSVTISCDNISGRRLLIQFAGQGTSPIEYYFDNFVFETIGALPVFDVAEKTVSDDYLNAQPETLSYTYSGREGASVTLTPEGLNVAGVSTGFCGVTYSNFSFSDEISSMTVKIRLVKTVNFTENFMLLINGGGSGYDQQTSSAKPLNEEFVLEYTVVFRAGEIPTSINFVACYSAGSEIGFLIKEISVTAHGSGFDESGYKTELLASGDYYRENFDAIPDNVHFDIEYGGATTSIQPCDKLSGNSLYFTWESGTPYVVLNGVSLGANLTYEMELDICILSENQPVGINAVLQKTGFSDISKVGTFVKTGDIYKVKMTLVGDDVAGRRLIFAFNFDSTPFSIALDNFSLTAK